MIEHIELKKNQKAEGEAITSIISSHLKNGDAVGLWRLPDETKKHLIICTEGPVLVDDIVLEELGTGFAFAPFDTNRKKVFLKANISYSFEAGEVVSHHTEPVASEQDYSPRQPNDDARPLFHGTIVSEKIDADKLQYLELVKKSIDLIQKGKFEKLVPSRCKTIALAPEFDLVESFNKLCSSYPGAFVSLVSSSQTGTWMGASPELLVSVNDKMHFKTTAVAGTQKFEPETDIKQVAWTQKEIEEQALVSRYIINCFKKIRLREFEEHGPRTWRAGNLLHLKTDFEVDMVATNFSQLGSVMLKLLHPTSAVCGMPHADSYAFLTDHERFDRNYYSGYLGPVNYKNETHLFVNLRCMQWRKESALLFAGAGVTVDSIPEKEWEETEMKMNTLLQVIRP